MTYYSKHSYSIDHNCQFILLKFEPGYDKAQKKVTDLRPCYSTLSYDIALLRLSTDATLNTYVQLAALPPSGQVLPHNNNCYITGWGRTQSKTDISSLYIRAIIQNQKDTL